MLKIHHLGIVVKDIEVAIDNYLGMNVLFKGIVQDVVCSEQVKIALVDDGVFQVEFIEPISNSSPVTHFLNKGGGMHHICYSTDNIDRYLADNKKEIKVIKKKHKGFLGYETAFFIQRNFESGIPLVELVEIKPDNTERL